MNVNSSAPERLPRGPDFLVRNRVQLVPECRIVVPFSQPGPRWRLKSSSIEPAIQVGTCTPLVMDSNWYAIWRQFGPDGTPHRARHFPVEGTDPVDMSGRAHGQRRHVELWAIAVVVLAEREKTLTILANLSPAAREMLFDELKRKNVVPGRYGSVGREDRSTSHIIEGRVERRSALHQFTDALQCDKRGVSLVQMPHRGLDAERA